MGDERLIGLNWPVPVPTPATAVPLHSSRSGGEDAVSPGHLHGPAGSFWFCRCPTRVRGVSRGRRGDQMGRLATANEGSTRWTLPTGGSIVSRLRIPNSNDRPSLVSSRTTTSSWSPLLSTALLLLPALSRAVGGILCHPSESVPRTRKPQGPEYDSFTSNSSKSHAPQQSPTPGA